MNNLRTEMDYSRPRHENIRAHVQQQYNQLDQKESVVRKIIFYLPDIETPYSSKFEGSIITLRQFKSLIN